jgi:hypothetical protein
MVSVSVPTLPAASVALTVTNWVFIARLMPGLKIVQLVVPDAVPDCPYKALQLTLTTPTASEAVPAIINGELEAEYIVPAVGIVIVTTGAVVSPGGGVEEA